MIITLKETDLPLVLDCRHAMMSESGMTALLAGDWRELTSEYYARCYRDGSCVHFGWQEDGQVVAIAGALIRSDFPHFTFKRKLYGWVMDVYVKPEYRRRGLARRLTRYVLDWLRMKDVTFVKLYASQQARAAKLYEPFGFTPTGEMMARLEPPAR